MRSISLVLSGVTIGVLACVAHAQVRIAQWNLAEMRGEPAAIDAVIEALSEDDYPGFAAPVGILTIQEADSATYNYLLTNLGPEWSAATYTNQNEDNYGGAQACFYHAATLTEDPSGHDDTYVEAGRRADRWKFSLNGHDDPPVEFYVYSAHLKAGNNGSSEADRTIGAGRIIDNMGEIPAGSRVIVTGDMNFYDNDEAGYQTFLDGGLVDPLGSGSWAGASNTLKHSQSPRVVQADGLANGGLDDRFDLHLATANLQGVAGLTLIAGSYRAVGNDGNHYNIAINDGTNSYWPADPAASNALADAIHDASDHLPVVADYRLPAVLDVTDSGCDVGTVIEGYQVDCVLDISNAGDAVIAGGTANLNWALSGTGVLDGNDDSGQLAPGDAAPVAIDIDTTVAGTFADELLIESDDELTQHAPATLAVSGHVLRHANPSFISDGDNDFFVYFIELDADAGVAPLVIQFWNYQWDENQARMDVDEISDPDAPLSFLGGTWQGVGPFPVSIPFEFDTTGLAPGTYVRPVTIVVSDEDLPGESTSSLHVTFNVTIREPAPQCTGDVTGDGVTDISDLLAFLEGFGGSDPALDLVPDGIVDVNDMLVLLGDFGCE
ncbi:MAG: GC-type dockerin domain-anchored protein [Phycisphaerales bacterium]|jgi:hypothetical protein|nr:GC-type dockerin domain-anchored protein [Phycisphaerales bacterium]